MSDDIVARLRAEEWVDGSSVSTLINPNGPEAADEIERLRALMRNVIDDDHYHMLAERTRARIDAALNKGGGDE